MKRERPAAESSGERPPVNDQALRIAHLEGRIEALETALERRSVELRLLQRFLSRRGLAQLSRLASGLAPLPLVACEPAFWRETCDLTEADVPDTLPDLWASIYPRTDPQ